MAENGSVSGHYDGENYASPSPSTGSGNSIRHMGGTSKELFNFISINTRVTVILDDNTILHFFWVRLMCEKEIF